MLLLVEVLWVTLPGIEFYKNMRLNCAHLSVKSTTSTTEVTFKGFHGNHLEGEYNLLQHGMKLFACDIVQYVGGLILFDVTLPISWYLESPSLSTL